MDRRGFLAGTAAWVTTTLGRPSPGAPKPHDRRFKVIVIGGGYGGATAARYLKIIRPDLDVTLVIRAARYLSCPGSNEVIGGLRPSASMARGYDRLAHRFGIRVVQGEVVGLERNPRRVVLAGGTRLPFDRAVLSPGIGFRWTDWPGYDEAAARRAPGGS